MIRRSLVQAPALGQKAWEKYASKYNETTRASDDKKFHEQLKQFDERAITPLSAAWRTLIATAKFKACFTCNHDPQDIRSGQDFLGLAQLCVKDACGRADVRAQFEGLLAADPGERDNIWVRALILDQDTVATKLAEAEKKASSDGTIPWSDLAASLGSALDQVVSGERGKGMLQGVADYIYQVGSPVLKIIGEPLTNALTWQLMKLPAKRLFSVLAWTSRAEGHRLAYVTGDMTAAQKENMLRGIIAEQAAHAPKDSMTSEQRNVVQQAVTDLPPEDAGPKQKARLVMLVDDKTADQVDVLRKNVQDQWRANAEARTQGFDDFKAAIEHDVQGGHLSRTDADKLIEGQKTLHEEAMAKLKKGPPDMLFVEAGSEQMTHVARSGVRSVATAHAAFGIAGLLLAAWSLTTNWHQEVTDGDTSSKTRYSVSAVGALASLTEIAGEGLKGSQWGATRLSRPISNMILQAETRAELLAGAGRLVGAAAGMVLGVWEFLSGVREWSKNKSLALLHIGGGILTFGVSLLVALGMLTAGVGFILFVAIAVISFVASFFVDNKFQAWLGKSYYGTDSKSDKYKNLVEQHQAFLVKTGQVKKEVPVPYAAKVARGEAFPVSKY